MTWAITIVPKPVGTLNVRNNDSSDEPSTTSGVASGNTSNNPTAPAPRNRYRHSAKASIVPNAVASKVDSAATRRLRRIASTSAGYRNGSSQAATENPFQTKLNLPAGLLKL